MKNESMEKDICCPEFDPAPWNEKIHEWDAKKFIKGSVFTLFFMPVNFGSVIRKLDKLVRDANATIPDWLCLSDHTSKWNMDLYMEVSKEIQGVENVKLSGKFLSKVYEGPFSETGKWSRNFEEYVRNNGFKNLKQFMWYTTCPKCTKKYGKNYTVIIAQVEKI